MKRRRRCSGFSVVELVVILAVAGVLAAMLLPWLQAARAAARKASCSNNIRQLVLAAHLYAESWNGMLPGTSSGMYRTSSGMYCGNGERYTGWWSWQATLLPYLGEEEVYNQINWSFSSNTGNPPVSGYAYGSRVKVNTTAVAKTIDRFLCPSDNGGRLSYMVNYGTWYDYDYSNLGRGRFDAFGRHWDQTRFMYWMEPQSNVVLGANIRSIPDGAATTVMFGEVVHAPRVSGLGPAPKQQLMATGQELRSMSPEQARQLCLRHRNGKPETIVRGGAGPGIFQHTGKLYGSGTTTGQFWYIPAPNRSGTVHGLLPPNSTNCLGQYSGTTGRGFQKDGIFGLRCASSWHRGGTNLGFADGSVRLVADEVDPQLYTALFSVDRGDLTHLP